MDKAIAIRAQRELIDAIARVRDACKQFMAGRIKEERDQHPGLPDAVIERMLTRGDKCLCRVAQRLIQEQQQHDPATREALRLDERNRADTGSAQGRAK